MEGDPVTQINTRARAAVANSKAAFGAIGELRREVRSAVARDMEDHQEMTRSIDRVDTKVEGVNTKVDKLTETMGDMRESMGEVRGTLHILVNQLEADRNERAESAKLKAITEAEIKKADAVAKIEAEAEIQKADAVAKIEIDKTSKIAAIDETTDRAKHKRKVSLKVIGAVLTALAAGIGLLSQC